MRQGITTHLAGGVEGFHSDRVGPDVHDPAQLEAVRGVGHPDFLTPVHRLPPGLKNIIGKKHVNTLQLRPRLGPLTGSPMSHVEFKKWLCQLSLFF